jgi:hypothetical protein
MAKQKFDDEDAAFAAARELYKSDSKADRQRANAIAKQYGHDNFVGMRRDYNELGGSSQGTKPTPPPTGLTEEQIQFWNDRDNAKYPVIEDPEDETPAPPGLDAGTVNARKSAREYLDGLFKQFGFSDADRATLLGQVDGWITEGLADAGTDAVLMKFRGTDVYARRFAGMAELRQRGQAMSEAEYIQLESSYRNVMQNYGIKDTFYNSYDDFARLIGAGLSPREVEERVVAAKQAMNPLVAAELREYYNIEDGDLTAYMLGLTDEKGLQLASARNQNALRTESRAAQIGAAAERAGFSMNRTYAERLGGTSLGQNLDPFQMETMSRLEGTFDQARRVADRETTLAGIDNEAYDQRDALAAAFGDQQATLASERRAKRERSRFSGSSGAGAASLGVERNL